MPASHQMPPFTADELELFLSKPLIAKISTLNRDGSIHMAPLLFKYTDGFILLGTQEISRKAHNVKRNPNATVLIDESGPPAKAVIIYGEATLDYNDVIEKRAAIFEKYGRSHEQALEVAEALAKKWAPVIIRIKPRQIISFDYGKGSLI